MHLLMVALDAKANLSPVAAEGMLPKFRPTCRSNTYRAERPLTDEFPAVRLARFVRAATSVPGRLPEITNGCFVEAKHENVVAERRTASEKLDRRFWVEISHSRKIKSVVRL